MNDALDHEISAFLDHEETPRGQASRRQERLIKQQEQKIKMLQEANAGLQKSQ